METVITLPVVIYCSLFMLIFLLSTTAATIKNSLISKLLWLLFLLLVIVEYVLRFYISIYISIPIYKLILYESLTFIILFFIAHFTKKDSTKKFNYKNDMKLKLENNNEITIKNFSSGISIFSASGFGKTTSVLYPIAKEFRDRSMSGVVYDYKNGEFTEIYLPLYKDKADIIDIFSFDDIHTKKINVLDPKLYTDETAVKEIILTLMQSLLGKKAFQGPNAYFANTATSLLTAVAMRFIFDFPQYSTLPNVIAFLLGTDFSNEVFENGKPSTQIFYGLDKFLKENHRSYIQAKDAILAFRNPETISNVSSTLFNALTKLSNPKFFWSLSESEIDLDINKSEKILIILNNPTDELMYTPALITIFNIVTKRMQVKGRNKSFLMIDEASTIELENMAGIVATMRTFGVSTVYCTQDISQGRYAYSQVGFDRILSNLSTQFFGKANEPNTMKFYEGYMEKIKVKEKSHTKGNGRLSITSSFREKPKIQGYEFGQFERGEFMFITEGTQERIKLKNNSNIELIPYNPKLNEDDYKILSNNYDKILKNMRDFSKDRKYGFYDNEK